MSKNVEEQEWEQLELFNFANTKTVFLLWIKSLGMVTVSVPIIKVIKYRFHIFFLL
jgi:peptidoglycan biosynthesis protein MviN/MurJ (putative lipid II flippase)